MTKTLKKEPSLLTENLYLDSTIESHDERLKLFNKLTKPNRKQEAWRYFQIKKLTNYPQLKGEKINSDIIKGDHIDIINGYITQKIDIKGVTITKKDSFDSNYDPIHETNPFIELNNITNTEEICIELLEKISSPIKIRIHNDEKNDIYTDPKITIIAHKNSEAEVFVIHEGEDENSLENSNVTLDVKENSKLNYLSVKNTKRFVHESIIIKCEKNSYINASYISPFTTTTRHDAEVFLNGTNANCYLNGLSILKNDESFTFKTRVHHKAEECESYQHFKNILSGESRAEYNGLVEVYKDAQLTDSYQLNRNLILSETAKAYSRPQLRIFADDVKCSHGSTTGQIEESEILYLMSRGLTRSQAHAILVFGFADEVLESAKCKFAHDEIREQLQESLKKLN